MAIRSARDALSRIFYQRCFWLFIVLLALIGAVSFVSSDDRGRLTLNAINMFLLISAIAAVGRTTLSFVIAVLLAIPALFFQYSGLWNDDDSQLAMSWMFSAALYFTTTTELNDTDSRAGSAVAIRGSVRAPAIRATRRRFWVRFMSYLCCQLGGRRMR